MKKIKKYILLILLACTISFTSCEDYLDANHEFGIEAAEVFSDYDNYKEAVDYGNVMVMNYMANKYNWAGNVGAMSDENQHTNIQKTPCNTVNVGAVENLNWRDVGFNCSTKYSNKSEFLKRIFDCPAGKSIYALREMSICINSINQLETFPDALHKYYSDKEMKDNLLGQSYFLRAWHYYEVVRRYGPMMLMDTTSLPWKEFPVDYEYDQVRPSMQTCADMMARDLDSAYVHLPLNWKDPQDKGRVTKTSALALKGIIYLFAASPLNNTGFDYFPTATNTFGQDSYNLEYAKKGIKSMVAALKEIQDGGTRYSLYDKEDYQLNWTNPLAVSDEALFQPVTNNNNSDWGAPMNQGSQGQAWFLPNVLGGAATMYMAPTQNIVDKFETIDGYAMKSSFDSDAPKFNEHMPYVNRDPRLKFNIICPGDCMYESDTLKDRSTKNYYPYNEYWSNDYTDANGKHWGKGLCYLKNQSLPATGYYCYGKYIKRGQNKYEGDWAKNNYRIFPHIRIADMYLGIAELANEVYKNPDATITEAAGLFSIQVNGETLELNDAKDFLNVIRRRVGMPKIEDSPVYTSNPGYENFQERVRNERAVEFFFEFKRYFDIKRWRIAPQVLTEMKGAVVTRTNDGYNYSTRTVFKRIFKEKNYWYPFSTEDKNKFKNNFKQNPGWD